MEEQEYTQYEQKFFPSLNNSLVLGSECHLCKQHGYNFIGQDIIWGNGNKTAAIMIIGMDSAGADDKADLWQGSRRTLMPLTNKKTGLKLRIFLHKAGIDPFSVFITNVVKCNVGRDQLRLSFESLGVVCRDYLEQEITIIKPRAILTLGTNVKKVVTQMVTKKKQLESLHLITSEVISGQPPFLGEFSSGVQAEIFHLRHPSWVEGPRREANYVKNLEIIKNHLKV